MCILTLASHLVSVTFLELVESNQKKMLVTLGKLAFWLGLLQYQSPCRQGLHLQEAKVPKATVDSQVLASNSPIPSGKKETGDALWSHFNEHVGSM